MKTETLFVIAVLVLFFILILIWNIKDNAYKKGYKQGYKQAEFDVTNNMLSVAAWFGSNKTEIYNTLYLFAKRYRVL